MPQAKVGRFTLHYEDHGPSHAPAVVFLSGLGGDSRAFSAASRHFADHGRRALALDYRDVGRSQRAETDYDLEEIADEVNAWLAMLEIPCADVVGHSMGGLVAQCLAIRHPARVRCLVLCSTHKGSDPWRRALVESWIIMRGRTEPGEFSRITLPWLVAPEYYKVAGGVEGLIRFAERNAFPQPPEAFIRQARAVNRYQGSDAALAGIRVPALVATGDRDLVNPPATARELAEALPHARLVILPGVGHLPHVENPLLFRQTIENFLALRLVEA